MKFNRRRVTASGIASDNMEEATKCEYEANRAAFDSANAATAFQDLRVEDQGLPLQATFGSQAEHGGCRVRSPGLDWLDAIEAMNKLKFERVKVLVCASGVPPSHLAAVERQCGQGSPLA